MIELPHLILRYIINHVDCNTDRLNLSLTCRKLYQERDKYLIFDTTHFTYSALFYERSSQINLNSYRQQFKFSQNNRLNQLLYIVDDRSSVTTKSTSSSSTSTATSTSTSTSTTNTSDSKKIHYYIHNNTVNKSECLEFNEQLQPVLNFRYLEDQPLSRLITTIRFDDDILEFDPLLLPSTVHTLILGEEFNRPLTEGMIPAGIQTLVFGYKYNQLLFPGVLPPSVTDLTLQESFNQPLYRYVQSTVVKRNTAIRLEETTVGNGLQSTIASATKQS
ncbi:hypothetical protein PPL_00526 [Heterostelium album PN500]|uniref:F-box domain-containing protein n=1 Tax=Heterostelium pallidum (strain ATCC 26659 / Pp 5 / PN500) TaxID=670386 RepID=D3AWP8_HETP5|nr:hypothetical protein PPL_00526 [Heterostelium album PN500]EFA86721.1 hypothetical protein PPL_00526 [Heterostelium album PN500]|eukprot:XP_020438825.1 hypothetical protein PPL_00526 [Heterostelium album PN500]